MSITRQESSTISYLNLKCICSTMHCAVCQSDKKVSSYFEYKKHFQIRWWPQIFRYIFISMVQTLSLDNRKVVLRVLSRNSPYLCSVLSKGLESVKRTGVWVPIYEERGGDDDIILETVVNPATHCSYCFCWAASFGRQFFCTTADTSFSFLHLWWW